ncbi:MAG: hypothetical protein EXR70_09065 [Deltaproteobacteria bacterium]|nr:hypothetical protein [Deltaproteobacteria bacterium]
MALIIILSMAVWTLLLIRLFAVGATLSERTVLTYLALGALMALTAAPLAEKIIVPYPLREYGYNYLGALLPMTVRNLVLLAPVATYLLVRRNHRLVSVADAFLLGFAIGFGYEMVGAVLGSSVAVESLRGVTLLPPWQMTWDNLPPAHFTGGVQQRVPIFSMFRVSSAFAIAGAAYSAGLVVLVFVAVWRFWGKLSSAIVASAVLLLLLTAHEALWANQFITVGAHRPGAGLPWIFDLLLLHGKLIAPAALATLLYCTVREFAWVAAATGDAGSPRAMLIDEFQNLIVVFRREGFAGYRRASAESRLRRQIELAKAESQRAQADRELFQTVRLLEIKQNEDIAKRATGHRESGVIASVDMRIAWAAWSGLALIVVLIPWLPS